MLDRACGFISNDGTITWMMSQKTADELNAWRAKLDIEVQEPYYIRIQK